MLSFLIENLMDLFEKYGVLFCFNLLLQHKYKTLNFLLPPLNSLRSILDFVLIKAQLNNHH